MMLLGESMVLNLLSSGLIAMTKRNDCSSPISHSFLINPYGFNNPNGRYRYLLRVNCFTRANTSTPNWR